MMRMMRVEDWVAWTEVLVATVAFVLLLAGAQ
jgi:hypothetical protein